MRQFGVLRQPQRLGDPQARLYRAAVPPLHMLGEEAADAGQHVRRIVDRMLRTSKQGPIDWTKVGGQGAGAEH